MTRQDYIAGLERIREQMKEIGKAYASVDLTDATGMESDRRKKTTKIVADLCDRLYEDIAISAKVAADKAEEGSGEQGDLFDDAAKTAKAEEAATPKADAAKEAEVVEPKMLPAPKAANPVDEAIDEADGDLGTKKGKRGRKGKKGGK